MNRLLLSIALTILCLRAGIAQQLPEGYILQYQQGFSGPKSLADFTVDHPESWGIFNAGGNFYLRFQDGPDQRPVPGLPGNIAMLNNHVFGDFILEASVMPEPDRNGFSEICFFLGMKDRSRYYYIQLASRCDSLYHGIFLVKDSVVKRLTGLDARPENWEPDKWKKIHVERNIVKRSILVYVGDSRQPVLQSRDYELVMGSVGFGSVSSAGRIDNIRIWAPTVISEE